MKIERIVVYQVDLPLHEGDYNWSGGKSVSVFDSTIVRVETDTSVVGHGEVCPLDDLAAHIFLTAKNISQAIRSICNPDAISHLSDDDIHRKGYNLMEHYKFHIIPRFDDDKVRIDWGNPEDPGLETRVGYANKIKALM